MFGVDNGDDPGVLAPPYHISKCREFSQLPEYFDQI